MRIASITAENFLGARDVRVQLDSAVTLFAGPNAAGKSSVRDAIALALTADLGRVSLKKDAPSLITEGELSAYCEVTDADGDDYAVTITASGKITDNRAGKETDPTLPYVLDAQRFAHLDVKERRAFLFDLMGVKLTPAEIKARLENRLFPAGCNGADQNRVDRVLPLLRSGFDAAAAEAKQRATQAKGAWRQVTGETYGGTKANTWRAPKPMFDAAAHAAAQNAVTAAEEQLADLQRQLGELSAKADAADQDRARRARLQATADLLERRRAKLATDEAGVAEWKPEVERLQAVAGTGPRVGLVHDLYRVLDCALAHLDPDGQYDDVDCQAAIKSYEREFGKPGAAGDPEAAGKLKGAIQSRDLYLRAIEADRRDIAESEAAAAGLKDKPPAAPKAADIDAARAKLEEAKAKSKAAGAALEQHRSVKVAADMADKLTREAAEQHAEVLAWDAIADALSPNGIPAELLAEALQPINDRLAQSALDAEWLQVAIDAEMHITGGGRAYRLLSESERWRVDAMVAEAIAHLSGARLLVLDRMDVLEPGKGRQDLFAWLHVLADAGEIDSALVFGTLRALPADLPPTIHSHWLEAGSVVHLKEAA